MNSSLNKTWCVVCEKLSSGFKSTSIGIALPEHSNSVCYVDVYKPKKSHISTINPLIVVAIGPIDYVHRLNYSQIPSSHNGKHLNCLSKNHHFYIRMFVDCVLKLVMFCWHHFVSKYLILALTIFWLSLNKFALNTGTTKVNANLFHFLLVFIKFKNIF